MQISRCSLVLFGLVLTSPGFVSADDAASREVVDKAIERNGGEKLLAKFKGTTSKLKGTIQINGAPLSFTGDLVSQGMDQQRISVSLVIDGQSISFASILNRGQGWLKINDTTVDMTPEQLTESKESAYSGWVATLLPLKDKAFQLVPFGEIEIAGRKVVGVNVTREGHRSINLFFDKETYNLVRSESIVRDEATAKEVTEESTYSEFKRIEGIQYPAKVAIKRDGQPHADVEVDDFKLAESLDDSVFAKP